MHTENITISPHQLQSRFLELYTVQDNQIQNIGLAILIYNATLSYARIDCEERSFYQGIINQVKNLLVNPFLKEYFSKKYDHLVRAGLKGDQARLNERFYANVLDPLDESTINGLGKISFPKEVRCDGELSLYEDVMATIFYSCVGLGQEELLLLNFKDLNPSIKEGAWYVLLDTFRKSKKLSLDTMLKIEAELPKDTSRMTGFIKSLSDEDVKGLSIDQIPEARRGIAVKALNGRSM